MKKNFLLSALSIPVFLFSQSNFMRVENSDEKAIRKIMDDQTTAWNRGDIEEFMRGYWHNDSLMFIGKSGINWGWQKTLDNYKSRYPGTTAMGKLSYDIIIVRRLSDEYYYVVGKWMLARSIGNLGGYYNLLIRRINGQWLIIADHSS